MSLHNTIPYEDQIQSLQKENIELKLKISDLESSFQKKDQILSKEVSKARSDYFEIQGVLKQEQHSKLDLISENEHLYSEKRFITILLVCATISLLIVLFFHVQSSPIHLRSF